jgi:proline racemase
MIKHVFAIDSHAAGMASRMIIGSLIWKKCKDMYEKMKYFTENYDWVRRALILEPRGHDNMFGSVICEPCDAKADIGAFYIHTGGTLNMCGHGMIALVTSLIELGFQINDAVVILKYKIPTLLISNMRKRTRKE